MAERPVLYSFRRCPYAMRARMAIAVSGVEIELREVLLRDKPLEMLAISPKGTVPVLVLPGGEVIDESLDIMRWALERNDPEGWLGHVNAELIAANDGPFKTALDRYKYPHRYGFANGFEYRDEGARYLSALDIRLQIDAYLCGASLGFTDIAIFPFIRQFAATDRAWFDAQDWLALGDWLTGLVGSELFELVMRKGA